MWSESRCRHIPAYVTAYKPFLLCVNRHVASTYCNGLLILQWKHIYRHLKIGKRNYLLWVFYMLYSTLKSAVCLTVYVLAQTLKIPDVIRDFPALWPRITPALKTMCTNHPACHDLDLNILVKKNHVVHTHMPLSSAAHSAVSTHLTPPVSSLFTSQLI